MADLVKYLGDTKFRDIQELTKPLFLTIKQFKKLYMINFTDKSDLTNKIVRQATGIILEKDTNKIVHYSFEKTYEGTIGNKRSNDPCEFDLLDENLNYTVEPYFEGSLIKMFYYKNKWCLATSKCINADTTHWTSDCSFTELFKECIYYSYNTSYDHFTEALDKECFHTFLIQHPDNKLISNVSIPCIFYINKVNAISLKEERIEKGLFEINKEQFKQEIKNNDLKINYMIYIENKEKDIVTRVKLLTERFYEKLELRGNYPYIEFVYIKEVCFDPSNKEKYRNMFPSFKKDFDSIDIRLDNVVNLIYDMYVQKYIYKQVIKYFPKKYKKFLAELHETYKTTGIKTTKEYIYHKLCYSEPRLQSLILN